MKIKLTVKHRCSDSEEIIEDAHNYKGMYFEDNEEKYQDPVTGAHFEFKDISNKLEWIRQERCKSESREISISQLGSPELFTKLGKFVNI